MLLGYARVSTQDQNLDLQIKALTQAGCKRIFGKRPPQTISIVASEPFKLQFLEQARCHRNQIGINNAHNGMNE